MILVTGYFHGLTSLAGNDAMIDLKDDLVFHLKDAECCMAHQVFTLTTENSISLKSLLALPLYLFCCISVVSIVLCFSFKN